MATRQTHLPPRCPAQKKTTAGPIHGPISRTPHVNEFFVHHTNSPSQSSNLDEEPVWLDELLSDRESKSKGLGRPLRRSASDSITLVDGLADSLMSLSIVQDAESSTLDGNETSGEWDPSCIYGPNSPRRRCNSDFSNYSIVSALSEFVHLHQDAPEHADIHSVAEISSSDSKGDMGDSVGEVNSDANAVKRHSGQRSRVRKLQYIAELERKVNVLQTVESELAMRVASMLQQRVALSMENSKLKQQVARVRQEKLTAEGRHQALKKELEKLKFHSAKFPESKSRSYFGSSSPSEVPRSEATWAFWKEN